MIKGNLEYAAKEFNKNSNAQVGGVIRKGGMKKAVGGIPELGRIFHIYWFFVSLAFGAVLLIVAPDFSIEISKNVTDKPAKMAGVGFLVLVGVPILLITLLITIIGIPLSIGGGILFGLLVWIASIYGKFAVGTWLLSIVDKTNPWAALIIGLLIGVLLGFIPIIGGLIKFVIFLLGLGALIYTLKVRYRKESKDVAGAEKG